MSRTDHPNIIRNRDEILSREEARWRPGVPDGKKLAVIARNGYEGELEGLLARHGGADESGRAGDHWHQLVTTNKEGGGYNTFYECRCFGIPAELEAFPRNAEDISWRLRTNADYTFDVNGADELVDEIRDH